jgi:hypothetical protein
VEDNMCERNKCVFFFSEKPFMPGMLPKKGALKGRWCFLSAEKCLEECEKKKVIDLNK